MDTPSPRYILTRAVFLILAVIVVLYGIRFVKKMQRRAAIVAELRSLSSDSSFFQQFYADAAQKSLIRAIGLIAEANELGIPPETAIKKSQGIETKLFAEDSDNEEPPLKTKIITTSLRANYENFLKLGYQADFHTLQEMKSGKLPPIPSGPESGKNAVVATLIDAAASPGIEKVIANLEIRPPTEGRTQTDIEVATAKQLASDLADAKIIEEPVRDKIIKALSQPPAAANPTDK